MRVAVLTTFNQLMEEYSLCTVASNEIKMLVEGGHDVTAIVNKGFKAPEESIWNHPRVKIEEIPSFTIGNEGQMPADYEKKAASLLSVLVPILENNQICLTHDIIYQKAHRIYNLACRAAADKINIKWLHHLHSCPIQSPKDMDFPETLEHTPFPNSWILYPNSYDIPRVAKMFGIEESDVKPVHHPIDICEYFDFHEYTKKLVEEKDILDADVIGCYPLRLDRGKQPEKVIKIFAELKKLGNKVRLVIADFHSSGGDKVVFRDEMLSMLPGLSLDNMDITFTSQLPFGAEIRAQDFVGNIKYLNKAEIGCPRKMIKDLMLLSNLFILPSRTETYSLVAQEAALCKSFLVLNQDFAPMRSIYGDTPLYVQFGGNLPQSGRDFGEINTSFKPNEQTYYKDVANWINYWLKHEKAIAMNTKIRKERNLKTVYKNELESLLYGIGGVNSEAKVLSVNAN